MSSLNLGLIILTMLMLIFILFPIVLLCWAIIYSINKRKKQDKKLKKLSASQILLFLGGLTVVIAGIIYIGINWSQWTPTARSLAIFLPMLICYSAGASLFFNNQYKKQGLVFVVVGSLLFPLFLSITFKELELFATPFNEYFNLTVSLLTFTLYFGLNFVFRSSIWTLLYQGIGLHTYYYLLLVLGIKEDISNPTLSWFLLIPGTAYLLLSLYLYEHSKEIYKIYYSYLLSILTFISSFTHLVVWSLDNNHLSWWLIIPGLVYFSFGIWLERNGTKNTIPYWIGLEPPVKNVQWIQKYCSLPYLVGIGFIFFLFLCLAIEGTLLKTFFQSTSEDEQSIIGWSNVIVGVIYLLIAWLISKLKHFQLTEAIKYKTFFNLVGPLFILTAILYLGSGGKKLIYETLLLLSSLSFIFISIPKRSSLFLYIGTLFLIIYIFSTGREYFKDDVSWPVMLFAFGLIFMGISVVIEKIKRRHITTSKE